MKNTIYISLPINGKDKFSAMRRAGKMKKRLIEKGYNVVTPFDACQGADGMKYSGIVGRCIEALMECDAIFLLSGWSESRSCQMEWRCAQVYNLRIYQHLNNIPNNETNIT